MVIFDVQTFALYLAEDAHGWSHEVFYVYGYVTLSGLSFQIQKPVSGLKDGNYRSLSLLEQGREMEHVEIVYICVCIVKRGNPIANPQAIRYFTC